MGQNLKDDDDNVLTSLPKKIFFLKKCFEMREQNFGSLVINFNFNEHLGLSICDIDIVSISVSAASLFSFVFRSGTKLNEVLQS